MIVETRRAFLRRLGLTAAGAVASACESIFEDPQNLEKIKEVRSAQDKVLQKLKVISNRDALIEAVKNEPFIPLPHINGVNMDAALTEAAESGGHGSLVIKLPTRNEKFIFPALVEGWVGGYILPAPDYHLGRHIIRIVVDNLVEWEFMFRPKPLLPGAGPNVKVSLGQPLVEFDLSDPRGNSVEGWENAIIVKAWPYLNGIGNPGMSVVTRKNILKNPDGTFVTIPTKAT